MYSHWYSSKKLFTQLFGGSELKLEEYRQFLPVAPLTTHPNGYYQVTMNNIILHSYHE